MANLKIHYLKLANLFEGYIPIFPTLRFDIKGDHNHFTLKKVHGYPYLYAGLFGVLFIIPSLIMIPSDFKSLRFWLVELFILGIAGIVFWFFVASRSITINTVEKIIVFERNNIFKKPVSEQLWIQFDEFKKLISETKSKTINKFGQKAVYQGIYILYNDQKEFLFDLPSNFQLGDSHTSFIQCMEAIVKNE
ncbi:hypothetical protein J0X14_02885 [Muricauda sp. CAU 1633]|uniref:hypothetical protein n=1 Tax=Allomuricauda sp. CAU 1633 TaxID=2816036 RepID=UPI001A8F27E1|nr:hypothetical protein [Muricauda sp. CAU 1633]MBO0321227.1 hypothetical protein [Muricauda sp. CAU 1633]